MFMPVYGLVPKDQPIEWPARTESCVWLRSEVQCRVQSRSRRRPSTASFDVGIYSGTCPWNSLELLAEMAEPCRQQEASGGQPDGGPCLGQPGKEVLSNWPDQSSVTLTTTSILPRVALE